MKQCASLIVYYQQKHLMLILFNLKKLTSGSRVRGFEPGRSRWIFLCSEKSTARLPTEGKLNKLSHVPTLVHVKDPSGGLAHCAPAAKFRQFPPSLIDGSPAVRREIAIRDE
jgi:hypothetical protein